MKKAKVLPRTLLLGLSILGLAITIGLFLLIFAPFVRWQFLPYNELKIWVIDKTVPYPDYRKHTSLFWILKNEKISKPGGRRLYSEKSDYFGFYPYGKNDWRGIPLPLGGTRPDLIYIADTYGVYKDDFMQKRLYGELSPKIYGGLTNDEVQTIRNNLGAGNTFVAEFNTAASPTNLRDRQTIGRMLGLEWKGWIGRFFSDLSKGEEVPSWVIDNYEERNDRKWEFFGRGFVLLSDDDQIEILTEKEDLGIKGLRFQFREPLASALKSRAAIPFRSWFEWTVPEAGIETMADYNFDLTGKGRAKLKALGLEPSFPAIVRNKNTQFTGWYFAGDFVDLKASGLPYGIAGLGWLKRLLSDDSLDSNENFYWRAYVPLMRSLLKEATIAKKARAAVGGESVEVRADTRAFGRGFQVRTRDGILKDFFVRGVNLEPIEPGKDLTDPSQTVEMYRGWLDRIADMGANTVRVVTLLPPEFYKAFLLHNSQNPDRLLYLLQGILPNENPPNGNLMTEYYTNAFRGEIDFGVDAVYGRANVPERSGRAWGIYTSDVSPWLLGWIVGRELELYEVKATDSKNKGLRYSGRYVSTNASASPTESWIAESLDEVASIEAARYHRLHPVAFLGWPGLDPGRSAATTENASISINNLEITSAMAAGIFGAYDIYPYYPDFISNDEVYGSYKDGEGLLRFGGYLREFMARHKRYPALVAEFGLANGAGQAYRAADGLDYGGLDEAAAGRGILRMMEAIEKEGLAGGLVFEWMDVWAKRSWTTEALMIPLDRHKLWHNVADPAQNFGLMANETKPPAQADVEYAGSGDIEALAISADASYLNLELRLKRLPDFTQEDILLGFDTFGRDIGQMRFSAGGFAAKSGLEFLLRISSDRKAELLVIPPYNAASFRFASVPLQDGIFERMLLRVNEVTTLSDGTSIAEKYFDASALKRGDFDEAGNLWRIEGKALSIRLPWAWINVTDPSSFMVLQDYRRFNSMPGPDVLKAVETDGFVFDAILADRNSATVTGRSGNEPGKPYRWKGWDADPPYRERLKKSYFMIQKAWAAPVPPKKTIR